MKSKLKAPETKPLKLKYDNLLHVFAFNFNLRRYNLSQYMVWPGELKACLDPASKLPVLLGDGANARVTQAELTGDRWVHGGVSYAGGKAWYHPRRMTVRSQL